MSDTAGQKCALIMPQVRSAYLVQVRATVGVGVVRGVWDTRTHPGPSLRVASATVVVLYCSKAIY